MSFEENAARASVTNAREKVVAFVKGKAPGTLISYADLGAVMGLSFAHSDVNERRIVQSAVNRALSELERDLATTLIPVPKEGYRVAEPNEFVHVSNKRRTSGSRQIRRAKRVIDGAPVDQMTPDQRKRAKALSMTLDAQIQAIDRNNRQFAQRQEQIDQALGRTPKVSE